MTTTAQAPATARRRRNRPVRPQPPPWSCDNCAQSNTGARRRCADCGTTRD